MVVCGPDETENDLLPLGVNRNYFAISDAQAAFDAAVRDEMLRGVGGERVSGGYYLWRGGASPPGCSTTTWSC